MIQKTVGAAAKFERLTVGGDPAFFISGAPHGFAYIPARTARTTSRSSGWPGTRCSSSAATALLLRIEGRDHPRRGGADRRVVALERLAAGEAGLDRVPVRRPAARRAASTGRPRDRRSRPGSRPGRARGRGPRCRGARAARSRARPRATRGALAARPGAAGDSASRADAVVEPSSASRRRASRIRRTVAPTIGRSRVGLVGCPVARVQHRSCKVYPSGPDRRVAATPARLEGRLWGHLGGWRSWSASSTRSSTTPEALGDWLAEHGLADRGADSTSADVDRALEHARPCARCCSPTTACRSTPARSPARPRRAAGGLGRRRGPGRSRARAAPAPTASLGRLLAIVARAQADGHVAARMKACPADDCRLGVLRPLAQPLADVVHDGVCGNRAKARSYRARHR